MSDDICLHLTLAQGNYFEVVSYEEQDRQFEIRFSMTLINSTDVTDTLRVKDGYIKTRIMN